MSLNLCRVDQLSVDELSYKPLMRQSQQVVCFSRLLKCLGSRLYGKQCEPRSDFSYRSTLFASILNLSVLLGNYLQQTTSADDIFRCIFFLGALRVKNIPFTHTLTYARTFCLLHFLNKMLIHTHTRAYVGLPLPNIMIRQKTLENAVQQN